MNNIKSQGQTSEEDCVNLEGGSFVAGPFFKHFLENIRKQREVGLGFDMEMVRGGAETAEHRQVAGEKAFNLPETKDCDLMICFDEEAEIQDPETFFKLLKRRSPTGRYDHPYLPDMPRLNKAYTPPKEGDTFIGMEKDINRERLEKLGEADSPPLKKPKDPMIFKVTDLAGDEEEFPRLMDTLKRNQEVETRLGWPAPPMFIEAILDADIVARDMEGVMKQLTSLAREYKVQIYLGTKPALKTALHSLMYGAKKEDLDMSRLAEISVEKATEMYERNPRKVAIVGGGFVNGVVRQIIAQQRNLYSSCTWNFKDLTNITKLGKPARDWEQSRLRRGKGHNKLKGRGKK